MISGLPTEILHKICFMLDYESLKHLINASPDLKNKLYPIHLRKAEEIIFKLDEHIQENKVKLEKTSNNIKFLLDIGHCPLHLQHSIRNMGECLKMLSKLKRKKEKILRDIDAKVEETYDSIIKCNMCGVVFTDYDIARSHLIDLSLYC